MNDIDFWHEHIGSQLHNSMSPEQSTGAIVPHRTLKGVKPLRIGAIDAFYFGSRKTSFVLGRIDLQSTSCTQFIGTEDVSARRYLAQHLIDSASPPFICGLIGNANPVGSLKVTHAESHSTFCEAGKSFHFNLDTARDAYKMLSPFDWKKEVAPLIYALETYRMEKDRHSIRVVKASELIRKSKSELAMAVNRAAIKPFSGEYTILSWANIEEKK